MVRRAEVVQVAGEDIIGRPKLKSDMTKEPVIDAAARSERHRRIGHGNPGAKNIRRVLPKQAVYKARQFPGAISNRETRPKPPGEIVAFQSRTTAIVKPVVAEIPLKGEVMKREYRGGNVPAIKLQPLLGGWHPARWHVKIQVRVAAEYIDRRNILRGSNPQKKED